jgi:sulfofructose kinase
MRIDAIGLGLCAWDRLLLFDRYPGPNLKVQALQSACMGGGPVPTALAAFTRLGGRAAFLGTTGNDPESELIRRDLDRRQIDTTFLLKRLHKRSACAYIWVDRRDGQRTVALDPGEAEFLKPEELPVELFRQAPYLLIDGRHADTCLEAARLCQQGGGQVILDAGSPRDRISELLATTDHAVVSWDFVQGTFPGINPEDASARLQEMGPSQIVITCGDRGGYWRSGSITNTYPAFSVKVIDTTGAGDVFHGAYLFGLYKGWEIEQRCRFASGTAALACRGLGGRSTLPSFQEVLDFLE